MALAQKLAVFSAPADRIAALSVSSHVTLSDSTASPHSGSLCELGLHSTDAQKIKEDLAMGSSQTICAAVELYVSGVEVSSARAPNRNLRKIRAGYRGYHRSSVSLRVA